MSWLPVNRCAAEGLPEPHWLDSPNDRKAAKVVLHLRPYLEEAVAPLGVEVLINRQVSLVCTAVRAPERKHLHGPTTPPHIPATPSRS